MIKYIVMGSFGFLILLTGISGCGSYNYMVSMEENVSAGWSQVENVYQRRMDLIPNLVNTVQGYADFEKSTLTEVIQARANATKVTIDPSNIDAASLQKFQSAQSALGSTLSRLLVVSEQYPQLKANENFLSLQAQLEGTENRIAVERKKYNEVAQTFNTYTRSFPEKIWAGMFGFQKKAYFEADAGANKAPTVNFGPK